MANTRLQNAVRNVAQEACNRGHDIPVRDREHLQLLHTEESNRKRYGQATKPKSV